MENCATQRFTVQRIENVCVCVCVYMCRLAICRMVPHVKCVLHIAQFYWIVISRTRTREEYDSLSLITYYIYYAVICRITPHVNCECIWRECSAELLMSNATENAWLVLVQCGAECCSVVQSVAVCCSVVPCVAVWCSVLQCGAVCCSVPCRDLQE